MLTELHKGRLIKSVLQRDAVSTMFRPVNRFPSDVLMRAFPIGSVSSQWEALVLKLSRKGRPDNGVHQGMSR